MKYTNKIRILSFLLCFGVAAVFFSSCAKKQTFAVTQYEQEEYEATETTIKTGELYAENLCVATTDTGEEKLSDEEAFGALALFGIDTCLTEYAFHVNERIYPASTTKILTALLALEQGNLEDVVTVSENAINSLESGSSVCGLTAGDTLTLRDLLYGLLLESGNDSAVAIAEHISGSQEAFVEQMNERAVALGATQSHFVNAHGLHDENHYTTAYDLYLIFQECIKQEEFQTILQTATYQTNITESSGVIRAVTWTSTSYYATENVTAPEGVTVLGGKTGTTDQAGSCLILVSTDTKGERYISIVMGATDKGSLYEEMNLLLSLEL